MASEAVWGQFQLVDLNDLRGRSRLLSNKANRFVGFGFHLLESRIWLLLFSCIYRSLWGNYLSFESPMYQRQVDYLCARLAFYNWCQWEEEILHQLSCQRPKPWRPSDLHLISWKSNIWIFCQLGNGCPTNVSNWSSLQWKGWYFGFFSRLPYFSTFSKCIVV